MHDMSLITGCRPIIPIYKPFIMALLHTVNACSLWHWQVLLQHQFRLHR